MKDSGIAWINTIPSNWETKKIKFILQSRNENNNPIRSRDILSLTAKQGVVPLSEKEGGGNKPKEDLSAYKLAYPNDIVMISMNILSGSVGLSKYFGCVSPVYYMLRPIDPNDDVRYFNYIFQTTTFQKSLLGLGNGILMKESDNGKLNTIRMRIPLDKLGNLHIPYPTGNEQKEIADYLDSICPDIDILANDIQSQIDVLEEYKKLTITEVLLNGLNPNANMIDSGIEWIGSVADYAEIFRLKFFSYLKGRIGWQGLKSTDFIDEGPYCVTGTDFQDGKVNWNTCYHVSEKRYEMDSNIHIKEGDLLMTKDGTIGKLAIIDELPDKACLNSHLLIIRPLENKYINKYLYYVMQSHIFSKYYTLVSSGSTMDSLSQEKTGNFSIPSYSIEKQKKIVEYLVNKCFEINAIISEKKQQFETLVNYKKSLIYEYVTGKKQVKENA